MPTTDGIKFVEPLQVAFSGADFPIGCASFLFGGAGLFFLDPAVDLELAAHFAAFGLHLADLFPGGTAMVFFSDLVRFSKLFF